MDKPIKIYGYCAWHPKEGFAAFDLSEETTGLGLTGVRPGNFRTYEEFITTHEAELCYLLNKGWQITRVCLVEVDAPPTTKEG